MKKIVWLAFVLALISLKSSAAGGPDPGLPLVSMDGVPLADAIKNLARQAGANFQLDPGAQAWIQETRPTVTTRWTNVTAKSALDDLLAVYHLVMVTNPVTTVGRIVRRGSPVPPVTTAELGDDQGQPLPMIAMQNVSFSDAVQNLARQDGLIYQFDPAVDLSKLTPDSQREPNVDFRWQKITARQALVAVLDNYGLKLVWTPGSTTAKIVKKEPPRDNPQNNQK